MHKSLRNALWSASNREDVVLGQEALLVEVEPLDDVDPEEPLVLDELAAAFEVEPPDVEPPDFVPPDFAPSDVDEPDDEEARESLR